MSWLASRTVGFSPRRATVLFLLVTCLAGVEPTVTKAWSRATLAGQEAGAVFALITGGEADDRLIAVESSAANVVELHEHATGADGVMMMRAVQGGLAVAAKTTIELKPRSYHVMLIGLKAPLVKAAQIEVIFVFAHAGRLVVAAEVLDPWAMAYDDR